MRLVPARVRHLVGERLRDRLGVHDDARLPPIPEAGIASSGIVLRRYGPGDAAARLRLESSPGMDLWDADFRPATTQAEFDAWLAELRRRYADSRGPCSVAVCTPRSTELIGDITFWRLRDRQDSAEVGIALLPEARRQRWATAATDATVGWLHGTGFRRVEAHHVVGNDGACFVARTCGMPVEGVLRGAFLHRADDGTTQWLDACAHASLAP